MFQKFTFHLILMSLIGYTGAQIMKSSNSLEYAQSTQAFALLIIAVVINWNHDK